jgi:hypothetical protein
MYAAAATPDAESPLDPRAQRNIDRLDELAELGMGLARLVSERAHADTGSDVGAAALQFSRVAKAVRQTIALQTRLADPSANPPPPIPPWVEYGMTEEAYVRDKRAATHRFEAEMIMTRAIERDAMDDEQEDLLDDLHERLNDPADDERLGAEETRLADFIADICRALDFTPDWRDWSDDDWAATDRPTRKALKLAFDPPREGASEFAEAREHPS